MINSRLLATAARAVSTVVVFVAATASASPPALHAQEAIAVVVNPSNPLSDISLRDLGRLYKGDATKFPDGGSATVFEASSTRAAFYEAVLGMSVGDVQRHWIQATFSGSGAVAPEELDRPGDVLAAVADDSGSIAVIPATAVDDSVKVLTVDGVGPTDAGYPIR